MKILLVHNHYRSGSPGGEDIAFDQERELLESAGLQVVTYTRSNDEVDEHDILAVARTALSLRWSRRTHRELAALMRRERPDVAHFHNTFPLVSASGYAACRDFGVPVVQTLHNYRIVCAAATLYRDGAPCELCTAGAPWPAIRHRCYRGSVAGSVAVSWMLWRNWTAGVYAHLVDRYIVLTRFAAGRLEAAGMPGRRILVKPNFVRAPAPPANGTPAGDYAVYAGLLSKEKGILTLLDAWRELRDVPLKVLGDGPLMAELARRCRKESLPVELLGMRPRAEVLATMAGARVLVVPSECFEGLPLVMVEALACGLPVVASRIGSLEETVIPGSTGLLFEPGNAGDLAAQVRSLLADGPLQQRMRRGTRERYLEAFTPERSLEVLVGLYEELASARVPGARPRASLRVRVVGS